MDQCLLLSNFFLDGFPNEMNSGIFYLIIVSHFFLRKLVTGRINTQEFLSSNITSTNGKLIKDMLRRLDQDHQEIPGPYLPFLTDLGKMMRTFVQELAYQEQLKH